MAESLGDLFIRMGVDTRELDSGFVDAERTISENLNRLNREKNLIQIRGQIELDGLGEAASNTEKVRVQEEALSKQIEIQRDKIALLSTAYQDLSQRHGENADSTQNVALQLEKERLALSNLEKQTQDLSKQQEIAFGINFEMLGLIEPAIKGIDALIAAGRTIPIPHAKVAAAAAIGLSAIVAGSAEATSELRENNPAKVLDEDFDKAENDIHASWEEIVGDTERSTAEINESIAEIGETAEDVSDDVNEVFDLLETDDIGDAIKKANDLFEETDSILMRLAKTILAVGADFNDVRDYVRGVQDAVIKGDVEDPEVIALEKYGVVIQDTNGQLLSFDETLQRLYEGFKKAAEAGEAEAYVMMTNGQAVQNVLPFFKNLAEAEERVGEIQWSTLDAATLKEASDNLRVMEVQIDEFKNALSSLAAPAANMAIQETFELFKTGTQLIEENREKIVYWSFVLMEAIKSVKNVGIEAADWVLEKLKIVGDGLLALNEKFGLIEKIGGIFDSITDKIGDFGESLLDASTDDDNIFTRAEKATEDYNCK